VIPANLLPRPHPGFSSTTWERRSGSTSSGVRDDFMLINAATDAQAQERCRELDNWRKVVIASAKKSSFRRCIKGGTLVASRGRNDSENR
jgi:hypothetical protein